MPSLRCLVDFLNSKPENLGPFADLFKWPVARGGEKGAQLELRADLNRIFDAGGNSRASKRQLATKINDLGIVINWTVTSTGRLFKYSTFCPKSPRDAVYFEIHRAFESGVFCKLGKCLACQKFFVGEREGKKYCRDSCRWEYQNSARQEAGYFADKRKHNRANAIRRARMQIKAGVLPERVAKKSRLSMRTLKKEGLVDY